LTFAGEKFDVCGSRTSGPRLLPLFLLLPSNGCEKASLRANNRKASGSPGANLLLQRGCEVDGVVTSDEKKTYRADSKSIILRRELAFQFLRRKWQTLLRRRGVDKTKNSSGKGWAFGRSAGP